MLLASSRPPDSFRQNLPAQLTPLVGRTTDTIAICELFAEARLVTFTGSAGVGKTAWCSRSPLGCLNVVRVVCGGWSWPPSLTHRQLAAPRCSRSVAARLPGRSIAQQLGVELGANPLWSCWTIVNTC